MSQIKSIDLPLPEHWYWLPPTEYAPIGWQEELLEKLIPETGRDEQALASLKEQLHAVYQSVTDTGYQGVRIAVCAPTPWIDMLFAMLTIHVNRSTSLDQYAANLQYWTRGDADTFFHSVDPIDTVIPAGRALGANLIMGRSGIDELGQVSQELEERVVLAVEPPGCDDLVDIVAIASSLGSFAEMTQDILVLLQTLRITMKE